MVADAKLGEKVRPLLSESADNVETEEGARVIFMVYVREVPFCAKPLISKTFDPTDKFIAVAS